MRKKKLTSAEIVLINTFFPKTGVNEETILWLQTLGNKDLILRSMENFKNGKNGKLGFN